MKADTFESKKIVIIGAGNVGTHLAQILFDKGHTILEVFSRRLEKAQILADKVNATGKNDLSQIVHTADFFIIAVKDDAISEVSRKLNVENGIVAHTSGSMSIENLNNQDQYGSFYPLQTFSIKVPPNWDEIPFCIDSNEPLVEDKLKALAQSINDNIFLIDDRQREVLHLAAVIVNNFCNHLLGISNDICDKHQVSFEILHPLIKETIRKALSNPPFEVQTGPAKRNDEKTLKKHLSLIENPQYEAIYKSITQSIVNRYHKQKTYSANASVPCNIAPIVAVTPHSQLNWEEE